MKKDVVKQYTDMADGYDQTIRQLIPNYDKVLKKMVEFLPFDKNQAVDILDIGTGTGNIPLLLKRKFFFAHLTCLDATQKMIKMAKKRLSDFSDIDFICSRVQDFKFSKSQYDAVMVSMVFQNLESRRQKLSVYKKICKSLKAEGIFLLFGPMKAANDFTEQYYMKKWGKFMRKSFSPKETDEGWLTTYAEKDGPDTFLNELKMLQEAGFRYVNVIYKHDNLAIFAAMNFDS